MIDFRKERGWSGLTCLVNDPPCIIMYYSLLDFANCILTCKIGCMQKIVALRYREEPWLIPLTTLLFYLLLFLFLLVNTMIFISWLNDMVFIAFIRLSDFCALYRRACTWASSGPHGTAAHALIPSKKNPGENTDYMYHTVCTKVGHAWYREC